MLLHHLKNDETTAPVAGGSAHFEGLDGEGDEIAPARAWTKNQKSLLTF